MEIKNNLPVFKFALTKEVITACNLIKLNMEDFLPQKSEPIATGWDVRCAIPDGLDLEPGCHYKIPLGFRCVCPTGWWMELVPRSSTFAKKNLHCLYGKIDESYELEWMFACQYIPNSCDIINRNNPKRIEFGERIAQIIPVKRQEMVVMNISNEELDKVFFKRQSVRKGGFGSSGEI